jgi:hypothetical protein
VKPTTATSAEVKKMWVYTSPHTPSWRCAELVKHRDTFTLPFFLNEKVRDIHNSCLPKYFYFQVSEIFIFKNFQILEHFGKILRYLEFLLLMKI